MAIDHPRVIALGKDQQVPFDLPPAASWYLTIGRTVADTVLDAPVALLLVGMGAILCLVVRRRRSATRSDFRAVEREGPQEGAPAHRDHGGSELRSALWPCRGAFIGTAAFSFIINMLMLTGAIFMLQVYDRILPSYSVTTLVALCIIASILFTALGLLDAIRSRVLAQSAAPSTRPWPHASSTRWRARGRVRQVGGDVRTKKCRSRYCSVRIDPLMRRVFLAPSSGHFGLDCAEVLALSLELQLIKPCVGAFGAQEVGVRARFDHLSTFDDMNEVCPQNGGQTMRDHHRRAAFC